MNAGEAVYQGREGTGLAQVLNWKDYRPAQTQRGIDPLRMQRLMMQKKSEDDKKLEQSMSFENGDALFAPTLQRDEQQLRELRASVLDNTNNVELAKQAGKDLESNIRLNIKRSKAVREIYNMKQKEAGDNKNINTKRFNEYLNDYLFGAVDESGYRDFNSINESKANDVDFHPSVRNPHFMVIADAKGTIGKLQTQEILPEELDGNNQKFYVKEGTTWKLKTGPDDKIAPEIIDYYQGDESIYDSYLWNLIAEKNGFSENDRILREDREKIDAEFEKEQFNPEWSQKVREQIENDLNHIQAKSKVLTTINKGRDFNPNSGNYGTPEIKASILEGDQRKYRNFEEATTDPNGISSYGQFSVPYNSNALSNLEGIYPGQVATFTGVKTDPNTGKPTATFTDKNGFDLPALEWNQETIARLNNVAKSKGETGGIAKLIHEVGNASKKQKNTYVDQPALDQKTNELESIMFGKSNDDFEVNNDREGYINKLQSFFKNNGIDASIEVDRNYGAQWIIGGPYVKINDQQFDLSEGADKQKLKSLLYELKPAKFSKETKSQTVNPQSGPKQGEVMDGYRFKGGDPSKESNWEKVN